VRGAIQEKEADMFKHQPQASDQLSAREAMAVSLAERIALDPHTVTDEFFSSLKSEFSEDEIVEMVYACGIFNWGNKFNITMQLDSSADSEYECDMHYRQEELA